MFVSSPDSRDHRSHTTGSNTHPFSFDTKYGWGPVINFPVYRERAEIIPNHWAIRVTFSGGTDLYTVQYIEGENSKCFRNNNKNTIR